MAKHLQAGTSQGTIFDFMEIAEADAVNLGHSLIVPSVQELVKTPITTIPPLYIRPDQEFSSVLDNHLLPSLPVIDFQKLSLEDSVDSELEKFHLACKEWGFFQVLFHSKLDP